MIICYLLFPLILIAVNLTPKESVLTLFKNMDELRKTYHAMIPNGKDKVVVEPAKTGE